MTTINDYIKEHDKHTKDISDVNKRISDIVSNNGNGNKDSEIVDARNGKPSLRDRIDEVENKIAINNDVMTKETVDARVDFDGGIHKNLNLRLLEDFNNLYKLIYNSTLIPYEGQYITANNSYKGMAEDMQIKGRTLQNLLPRVEFLDIEKNYSTTSTTNVQLVGKNLNATTIKPNTEYTVILKVNFTNLTLKNFYIGLNYIDKSGVSKALVYQAFTNLDNGKLFRIKLTTSSDISSLSSLFLGGSDGSVDIKTGGFYMILEGDWANKEVPQYFEGIRSVGESGETLELVSCGKNLFNSQSFFNYVKNCDNSSFETVEDNEKIIDCVPSTMNLKPFMQGYFKENTQYTLKVTTKMMTGNNIYFKAFYTDGTISDVCSSFNLTYTTIQGTTKINKTIKYIYISYGTAGYRARIKLDSIQIEEGTTSGVYEQYKEHRQAITLTEPLRSLPNDVSDIVNFEKSVVVRNVVDVTFKGDENITLVDAKVNTIKFAINVSPDIFYADIYNLICDKFTTGINIVLEDIEGIRIASTYSGFYISIAKSKLITQDIAGFKTWLQANPTTVYYELATPVETPLTDLIPPRTYEGVTNIFTTGSLIEPILSCKVPSNIPAKIQTLSIENQALQAENIKFKNTLEENNLTNIETSVNQESKITMMELGVI